MLSTPLTPGQHPSPTAQPGGDRSNAANAKVSAPAEGLVESLGGEATAGTGGRETARSSRGGETPVTSGNTGDVWERTWDLMGV